MDSEVNYIVSGLERSGTSLLMQILEAGGVPVHYDSSRNADTNNPRGYYELESGKVISKLIKNEFPMHRYRGEFIKITAYGTLFLPRGHYRIIYSERNIDEIMKSSEKMSGKPIKNSKKVKDSLIKLNNRVKREFDNRAFIQYTSINYNELMKNPTSELEKIKEFIPEFNISKGMSVIDKNLYRNRK